MASTVYGAGAFTSRASFTPTGAWTTNTTYTGVWWRAGDTMWCDVLVSLAGAPNAATTFGLAIPNGETVDEAKVISSIVGIAFLRDSGTGESPGGVLYDSTNNVFVVRGQSPGGTSNDAPSVTTTVPYTWANGDAIRMFFCFPVTGW